MLTFGTLFECISHVSLFTDTRGYVVDDRARGVVATSAGAGVSTRVAAAGAVTGTVSIDQTLRPAAGEAVTQEAGGTRAGAASGVRDGGQGPWTTGVTLTRV